MIGAKDQPTCTLEVEHFQRIAEIDVDIKRALGEYRSGPVSREDYVRKRNALYAQRKYYKRKIKIGRLERQAEAIRTKNDKARRENEDLETILKWLEESSPPISEGQTGHFTLEDLPMATRQAFERLNPALQAAPKQAKSPPMASIKKPTDLLLRDSITTLYTFVPGNTHSLYRPMSQHVGGVSHILRQQLLEKKRQEHTHLLLQLAPTAPTLLPLAFRATPRVVPLAPLYALPQSHLLAGNRDRLV